MSMLDVEILNRGKEVKRDVADQLGGQKLPIWFSA
jgi:hypothetical protein